eukprot:m51a1_g11879 hypothetical protein (286) ;mRNA; f:570723-571810
MNVVDDDEALSAQQLNGPQGLLLLCAQRPAAAVTEGTAAHGEPSLLESLLSPGSLSSCGPAVRTTAATDMENLSRELEAARREIAGLKAELLRARSEKEAAVATARAYAVRMEDQKQHFCEQIERAKVESHQRLKASLVQKDWEIRRLTDENTELAVRLDEASADLARVLALNGGQAAIKERVAAAVSSYTCSPTVPSPPPPEEELQFVTTRYMGTTYLFETALDETYASLCSRMAHRLGISPDRRLLLFLGSRPLHGATVADLGCTHPGAVVTVMTAGIPKTIA